MGDCQQSQALDILILLYIPCLNTAVNHKNKIAVKQQEVRGTKRARERSRQMPGMIFAVTAAFKHQGAAPEAPRRLQDSCMPDRQETQFLHAASRKPAMHYSLFTSFRLN